MEIYDLIKQRADNELALIHSVVTIQGEERFVWEVGSSWTDSNENGDILKRHAVCLIEQLSLGRFATYAIDQNGDVFRCEDLHLPNEHVVVYFQNADEYKEAVFSRFVSAGMKYIAGLGVTIFNRIGAPLEVLYGDRTSIYTDGSNSGQFVVVDCDNFDGDYPDEKFVSLPCDKEVCEGIAEEMNTRCGPNHPRFYKVVQLPYELQPGFQP